MTSAMAHPAYVFDRLPEIASLLQGRPRGLIADVDGTLSAIAPSPELAYVSQEIKQRLRELRPGFEVVAAVSGRSAEDARQMLGIDSMIVLGNHGLEAIDAGQVHYFQGADRWLPVIGRALAELEQQLPLTGLQFEHKGASASVHYRQAPDPLAARRSILAAFATSESARALRVTEGKMVVELRPPLEANKGSAVRWLIYRYRLAVALYLGDDVTDVDAFREITALRQEAGLQGASIVVVDGDTPNAVSDAADFFVSGIADVERLLAWLTAPDGALTTT